MVVSAPLSAPLGTRTPVRRSGRRVALLARYPERDPAMPQFISNHGLRMVEATLRAAAPAGLELGVWDLVSGSVEAVTDALLRFDPDVIGFSAYLWSFPFFVEVARRLKEDDPSRLVVFGGPSARPAMLRLAPFRDAAAFIDVLVLNDGEETFLEIVQCTDRRTAALGQVRGIALPSALDGAWVETPPRPLGDLNLLASPYAMDLVPTPGLAVLQTYRGCPFTCSFCEWGTLDSPQNVRGVDELQSEFAGMARQPVHGALLVDAGLNLNNNAFRSLREAADRHGFFERRALVCEVYPARVRQEHIDFLGTVGQALVGIGLQSFDHEVLAGVDRSFDERRFEQTLHALRSVSSVAIEIIMGLPGDSPERFRRSFERARSLPCALRVYHCVVLPSALMVRSPPEHALVYDPVSLKMSSCLGWTEAALQAECQFLEREARAAGGRSGQFFWAFPPPF